MRSLGTTLNRQLVRYCRLLAGQVGHWDVAADGVVGSGIAERRFLLLADGAELARAAGVEDAARRRTDGARNLARKTDAGLLLLRDRRNRRKERLRIRMTRSGENLLGGTNLHEPAEIENGNAVGQI